MWLVFDNSPPTVHGNLSTSNNSMCGAPKNITNDDGDGGDSGGGGINDVNVKTITEATNLEMG